MNTDRTEEKIVTHSHRIGSSTITLSYHPNDHDLPVEVSLSGGPESELQSRRDTLYNIVDEVLKDPKVAVGFTAHPRSTHIGVDFLCKDDRNASNCEHNIPPEKAVAAICAKLEELGTQYKSFSQLQSDRKTSQAQGREEAWRKHLADQEQREAEARAALKAVIEKAILGSNFNPAYAREIMARAGDNICDAVMQHMQSQGAKIGG